MERLLKKGSLRLYMYLGSLLALFGLWHLYETINTQLATQPVMSAPKVAVNSVVLDQKRFYAAWAKQAAAQVEVPVGNQVDSLFKRDEEKPLELKAAAPVEPDFVALFRQTARIEGMSDGGMFISGKFYSVGQQMRGLTLVSPSGKQVIPRLVALADGKATFEIAGKLLTSKQSPD